MPSRNPLLPSSTPAIAENNVVVNDTTHPDRVIFRGTGHETTQPANQLPNENEPSNTEEGTIAQPIAPIPIHSKTKNWYSIFCNRWASLFGAIIKILIMLLVNSYYAIFSIAVVFLVWFYVGTANPAVKPGLAAEFSLFVWIRSVVFRCFG